MRPPRDKQQPKFQHKQSAPVAPSSHGERPDLIWGHNPLEEALRAGRRKIHEVLLSGKEREENPLIDQLLKRGIPYRFVGRPDLDRLSHDGVHQGVLARMAPYPYVEMPELLKAEAPSLIVALDGVTDPQNFGAICRSALAFGVGGLVLPKDNAAAVTGSVAKASAGAVEKLKIVQVVNLVRSLEAFKEAGYWIYGASLTETSVDIAKVSPGQKAVIVLGAEGKGLRRLVAETCDQLVKIPMPGGFESLNVAQAATLFFYEFARKLGLMN
jgi:23S rRNA (guanosine2251-2'-O)-methyltransferase